MEQRERLASRLGFILLSAGCAIGIGNVWKFPYMVGHHPPWRAPVWRMAAAWAAAVGLQWVRG